MSIDLNGSLIDKRDKVSSRKNVFVISTVFGLEVLIQCDCPIQAEEWLRSIQSAIKNLVIYLSILHLLSGYCMSLYLIEESYFLVYSVFQIISLFCDSQKIKSVKYIS